MIIQEFIKKLKEKNVELSEVQLAQFEDYRKLLQEYNKKINLTAIIETDELTTKELHSQVEDWINKKVDDISAIKFSGAFSQASDSGKRF